MSGESCEDGGVCAAGVCCAPKAACGEICCSDGLICSFNQCVELGDTCVDPTDCGADEYCEYALSATPAPPTDVECVGGTPPPEGRCLPRPPICTDSEDAEDGACFDLCEYRPAAADFEMQLEHAWTAPEGESSNIMMTPIVVQLDDDNCDGRVTELDIPDILFSTFPTSDYHAAGVLYAISIVNGVVEDKWQVSDVVYATKQIAGGDLDGLPGAEIVGCGSDGGVHAFHSNGDPYWTTEGSVECFMPSIADMDGDGHPEVVVEGGILDGQTGALLHPLTVVGPIVISDMDGDARLDIVTASEVIDGEGNQLVDTGLVEPSSYRNSGDWKGPWAAVADFDADGQPEVVAIDNMDHTLSVWRYDPSSEEKFVVVREPIDINGSLDVSHCPSGWGSSHGGGPPTIGDFNADGVPDVAVAGGVGYAVFDGTKLVAELPEDPVLWVSQSQDCSSASTGSSLFDFNGDGRAEVIYSDEQYLRVYQGNSGEVLDQQCNTTGTLAENPIVADVDGDGQADIVVVANEMSECEGGYQTGLRVFGSASGSWVRTRGAWNQHAYHITNVNDDGTIPSEEPPNWLQSGLNNFRQNKQPGMEFAAPDAAVSFEPACGNPETLVAVVRNLGQAALPAGIGVSLTAVGDSTTLLVEGTTSHMLYPAQAEQVELAIPASAASAVADADTFAVELDVDSGLHECRTDNNSASMSHEPCKIW